MALKIPNLSIRQRLLIGLLSMVVVAFSATLVKNYYDTRHEIAELFDAELAQAARVLLELSGHEVYEQIGFDMQKSNSTSDISEHPTTQIHEYQQEIDFQIWIQNNTHLAVRSHNSPTDHLTDVDETFGDRIINGQQWRVYSLSNEDNSVRVQVGQHYEERDVLSNSISIRLLTSFAIALPLLAILIMVIVGQALMPLRKITAQIGNRQVDNLQPISLSNVPDEVQPMVQSINSLFQRLQSAFDNIVLFTANAAHELRTPLAAQKVHAQVAIKENDPEKKNQAIEEVLSGVDRATAMVEQLLTLSRLDPEGELKEDDKAGIHKISEEVIAELGAKAIKKNIDISLDVHEAEYIYGKPAMIAILIRNIVENAIHYTPENGTLEVNIKKQNNDVLLRVSDSGPGIPAEERENVFKRFYRTSDNTQDGTGLGLALVERIAEIHHAEITLGTSSLGGLQMDVLFKAANKTT